MIRACVFPWVVVVVRFKAVGNAPIMKQNFYKITASNRFQAVIQFLRKELGWQPTDPLVRVPVYIYLERWLICSRVLSSLRTSISRSLRLQTTLWRTSSRYNIQIILPVAYRSHLDSVVLCHRRPSHSQLQVNEPPCLPPQSPMLTTQQHHCRLGLITRSLISLPCSTRFELDRFARCTLYYQLSQAFAVGCIMVTCDTPTTLAHQGQLMGDICRLRHTPKCRT
jgi:hypothetical protein